MRARHLRRAGRAEVQHEHAEVVPRADHDVVELGRHRDPRGSDARVASGVRRRRRTRLRRWTWGNGDGRRRRTHRHGGLALVAGAGDELAGRVPTVVYAVQVRASDPAPLMSALAYVSDRMPAGLIRDVIMSALSRSTSR